MTFPLLVKLFVVSVRSRSFPLPNLCLDTRLDAFIVQVDLPQSWRDLGFFALLGLFGVFGNQILFLLGMQATDANTAAIMQPAIVVFAVVIAMVFRLEPLLWPRSCLTLFNQSMRKFIGVALAILGTLVMAGIGDVQLNSNVEGLLFLTGNTFSYAAFICLQKAVLGR